MLRKLLVGSNTIYAVIRRIGYMLILSSLVAHGAVGLRLRSERNRFRTWKSGGEKSDCNPRA